MRPAKRMFDLVAAAVGLLLLWPVFLVIALLVKAEDGGPIFFRHLRVGYRGRPFGLWKFRTMVPDAESRGPALTVGRDPRITRVGTWLRRLKLDELPQLGNVLVGHMSLVGPRPEVPCYVATYDPEQRRVLDLMGSGALARGDAALFRPMLDELLGRDEYLLLADYDSYVGCQTLVDSAFADSDGWTRKSILTVARMGRFSSDRAIREYGRDIWHVTPVSRAAV